MSTELPAALTELLDTADVDGDGRVRLRDFRHDDRGCVVELELATNVESHRWHFSFAHCLDYRLQRDFTLAIALHEAPHVLLWPYTEPSAQLWFSGVPSEPLRVDAELRDRHRALAGRFAALSVSLNGAFARGELLGMGIGQLARGPAPLLREYAAILRAHGRTPTLEEHEVKGSVAGVRALTWGTSFVVGTDFDARRIDAA